MIENDGMYKSRRGKPEGKAALVDSPGNETGPPFPPRRRPFPAWTGRPLRWKEKATEFFVNKNIFKKNQEFNRNLRNGLRSANERRPGHSFGVFIFFLFLAAEERSVFIGRRRFPLRCTRNGSVLVEIRMATMKHGRSLEYVIFATPTVQVKTDKVKYR